MSSPIPSSPSSSSSASFSSVIPSTISDKDFFQGLVALSSGRTLFSGKTEREIAQIVVTHFRYTTIFKGTRKPCIFSSSAKARAHPEDTGTLFLQSLKANCAKLGLVKSFNREDEKGYMNTFHTILMDTRLHVHPGYSNPPMEASDAPSAPELGWVHKWYTRLCGIVRKAAQKFEELDRHDLLLFLYMAFLLFDDQCYKDVYSYYSDSAAAGGTDKKQVLECMQGRILDDQLRKGVYVLYKALFLHVFLGQWAASSPKKVEGRDETLIFSAWLASTHSLEDVAELVSISKLLDASDKPDKIKIKNDYYGFLLNQSLKRSVNAMVMIQVGKVLQGQTYYYYEAKELRPHTQTIKGFLQDCDAADTHDYAPTSPSYEPTSPHTPDYAPNTPPYDPLDACLDNCIDVDMAQ